MLSLPKEAQFLEQFRSAFTAPAYERFLVLCVGAIVTMGRRSVSRILWSVRCLMQGHPSSYHRFFCAARWSLWPIAKVLAAMVVELVPRDQPIVVIADDTVEQHLGNHVFAKGCHRDAVRSSWTRTVFKFGHKWVVLAMAVRLPGCSRAWALPVLAALYVSPPKAPAKAAQKAGSQEGTSPKPKDKGTKKPGGNKQRLTPQLRKRDKSGRLPPRHKTPALLARQMMAVLMHWFPDRRFVLLGGCGGWYRHRGSGRAALIPVRWVCVLDPKGGREDYFYTTDPSWTPQRIVQTFAGRWPIEVTFEEVRAHLGFEATRHWCRQSVLRVAPCLMGLFSVVGLIYTELARQGTVKVHSTPCYHKTDPTFADALAMVRRLLWEQVILQHAPCGRHVTQLPPPIREMLLEYLTAAA